MVPDQDFSLPLTHGWHIFPEPSEISMGTEPETSFHLTGYVKPETQSFMLCFVV
jgi:hypothetical protein